VRPAERRRRPAGLALAILAPALATAAAVLLAPVGDGADLVDAAGSPARLASASAAPAGEGPVPARALRPLLADRGQAGVEPSPLEPLEGGVRPGPPARIFIRAAGVDAVVEPVGLQGQALRVPALGHAGWWAGGPRPGEPGRAVVIGHLDRRDGPGLFARVPKLPRGTSVEITDRRGEVHAYSVVGATRVRKDAFPSAHVYGGAARSVLVLVTCGGPYDPESGYRDNVLVYARAT
jgi:hypothetical protein